MAIISNITKIGRDEAASARRATQRTAQWIHARSMAVHGSSHRQLVVGGHQNGVLAGLLIEMHSTGTLNARPVDLLDEEKHFSDRHTPVTLVLSKADYLTRIVTLPATSPDETRDMIRLEAEASLPPDYGAIEVSYRTLPDKANDTTNAKRYEVYVVRRQTVQHYLDKLGQAHLTPRWILPSAVLWSMAFDRQTKDKADQLLLAGWGDEVHETAHIDRDGAVHVRTLLGEEGESLQRGVTESLRAMARDRMTPQSPAMVGCLAGHLRGVAVNGTVRIIDRRADLGIIVDHDEGRDMASHTVLMMAGRMLVSYPSAEIWSAANLLPQWVTDAKQQRVLYRELATGAVCFILAMVMLFTAMKISTWRYQQEITRLTGAIKHIRVDGESIGNQLTQLQAVAEARKTHDDFGGIIYDLHQARLGEGLSYSQVTLRKDGTIVLRGQAKSLAIPFALPQTLEAMPSMANVVLKNAGQATQAAGSVTQFRIEATHQRKGAP